MSILKQLNNVPTLSKAQLENIKYTVGLSKPTVYTLRAFNNIPRITKADLNDTTVTASQLKTAGWRFYPKHNYTAGSDSDWEKILEKAALQVDYTDPHQLNSYADVLASTVFGTQFENKGGVYKFFEKLGLTWDGPLNIFGGIANLIDYTWQYNIKPITQGQWGTFGKNVLMNFSETVDTLANPVKGLILDGGAGFTKALGLTGEGRQNYDYDTGNAFVDVVLEIVSDPGVWASFGGTLLLKSAARAGGEIVTELSEAVIKSGVKELSESVGETATKQWLKRGFNQAARLVSTGKAVDVSDMTGLLITASKSRGLVGKVLHPLTKDLTPEIAQKLSVDVVQNIAEVLLKSSKEYTERTAVTILRTLDKIDTAAVKTAFAPVIGAYKGSKKIAKAINSRTLRVAEPFIKEYGALSHLDYNKVMSKTEEVSDSLVTVAKQQGLESFDNSAMQKAFYKSTKEDINNLQRIIKRYGNKSKNLNIEHFKITFTTNLVNRHGAFDELLSTEIAPNIAKKLTTSKDAYDALTTSIINYLKNPLDGTALRHIRSFFPEGTSVKAIQRFITDNVPLEEMLAQYAKALDDIAEQANLFDSLKGSFNNIQKTFADLKEAEDFIKSFADGTTTLDLINKTIKTLQERTSLTQMSNLKNIDVYVKNTFNDAVLPAQVSEVLKAIQKSDSNTVFTDSVLAKLQDAITAYVKNPYDTEAAYYLKLFLPENTDLYSFVNKSYADALDLYEVQLRVDKALQPLVDALQLPNVTTFKAFIQESYLTDSFKKVRLPEIKAGKSTLSLTEATAVFKQDVVDALKKYYDAVTTKVKQLLDLPASKFDAAVNELSSDLYDAIRLLKEDLVDSAEAFNKAQKVLLDDNPILKSNIKHFEQYGKELLSGSGTQKKITDLIENVTSQKVMPEISKIAYTGASELKANLTEMLDELHKLDRSSVEFLSEDGSRMLLSDTLKNAVKELEVLLKTSEKSFNITEFKAVVQRLDNVLKAEQKRIAEAIMLGEDMLKINNVYQAFYNKLETFVNNAYEVIKIPEQTFSLTGDLASYALKLEQTWNTLAYLESAPTMDFVYKIINRDSSLDPLFLDYLDTNNVAVKINNALTPEEKELHQIIGEACSLIQRGAYSISEYEQLLAAFEKNTVLDHEIREALLSSVNHPHIANMSVDAVAHNQDELFARLFEGVENYVNAGRKTGRYTLDAFRTKYAGLNLFEKRLGVDTKTWNIMAHHADADVITTKVYFEKELPDFKVRDNDITIDIETSSLDSFQGEVLEVSVDVNGSLITFKRHLNPETNVQGLSNKLLDLYAHGESNLNIVRENFYKYYNRTYTGPQAATIVKYFDSETELLEAVQAELYKVRVVLDESGTKLLKHDPSAPRLLGHNISGYDVDFLKMRAEKTGVAEFKNTLDRFEHVDSYKLIQEKHGFLKLNDAQKQSIRELMSDYIIARTRYADTDIFELYHTGEDFINAIPNELTIGLKRIRENAEALEGVLKTTDGTKIAKDFASDTTRHIEDLLKELQQTRIEHIRKPNTAYARYIFTEEQLNTNLFKSKLRKILKADPYYKKFTKQQLTDFVNYLNPTKAFYAGHELVNRLGFKKVFDPSLVRSWFNYVNEAGIASTEVPRRLGQIMFNTAKRIERVASYVKNPKALLHFQPMLDAFLNTVQESKILQRVEVRNPALKYIVSNTVAIADKYSLALFLRQVLGNTKTADNKTLLDLLPKKIVDDLDEVIDNHKLFTAKTIRDTDLTFAELTKNIASDEDWTAAAFYAAKADDFAQNIESFNFVDDFDKAGIFSPEKQIFAHGAQKVYRLFSDFKDWVAEATTKQLQDAQAKMFFITDSLNIQTLRNVLQHDTAEELLHKLVWTHGVRFSANDAPDIAVDLIKNANALKETGILLYKENDIITVMPDRRVLDIKCEIRTVDDVATKHVLVGKKGMPLQEVPQLTLKELDVDTAIELCRKEFTLELGAKGRAVVGAIDDARLTQLGANLKQARVGINTITNGAFAGVHADIMDKATLRYLYENSPAEVQAAFGDINALLDDGTWFSGTTFNLFNLGSNASKRTLQPGISPHFLTSYETTAKIALKKQETRFKFIDMMLNNDMRLDIGVWADEANDAAVIKYLNEHPELTVAVLHKAKNARGYNIKRVVINTVEDLHNARKLHASVLTNQMYSRTASVIYSSVYNSGVLNAWAKIAKLYKIGQLSVFNLGVLFRNFIDSTLKMFISTRNVTETLEAGHDARQKLKGYNKALYGLMATAQIDTEVVEQIAKAYNVSPANILNDIGYKVAWYKQNTIKDVINASVLYEKYNTALDDIIKMDSNAIMRPQNIEFYFNYMAKDFDIESFYEVHKFITQGASAGSTTALRKVFAKDAGDYVGNNVLKQIKEVYDEQGMLDTIVHVAGKLGGANAQLEQIIRLTQHMQQMRSGLNFAESNAKIAKVHFDYADKTDITKSMELIFPYYSFKMKNFAYWADLLESQPWVYRLFEDVMTPIWDFDSYDTYQEHLELANNESLTYQILAGNIPLNDSGLVLKTNPSIMDAVQMVTDPFGNAQNSLWSPFNEIFKTAMLEQWKAGNTDEFINNTFGLNEWNYEHQRSKKQKVLYNLPLVGATLQRQLESKPKYKERSNSPLLEAPSLFGAVSRWNLENIKSPEEYEAYLNNLRSKYKTKRFKNQFNKKRYTKTAFKRNSYRFKQRSYKPYKSKNYYYNSYNPNYSKYVSYYDKPYNRYAERSLIHKTQVSRPKRVYTDNIYWKYYTKSGKRRMDILNAKTTRKNLQMKIKLMYDYYR